MKIAFRPLGLVGEPPLQATGAGFIILLMSLQLHLCAAGQLPQAVIIFDEGP